MTRTKSLLMLIMESARDMNWPLWKKVLFRFFFIFFALYMAPWTWLDSIPNVNKITGWYHKTDDWAVRFANEKIFHIKEELVPVSGSGDTSWGWAQLYLFLFLALVGCLFNMVSD